MKKIDITQCWGKKENCTAICEFKETCRNKFNEQKENTHYQIQHISVPNLIYDPQDEERNEKDSPVNIYFSTEEEKEVDNTIDLPGISIPPSALPAVMTVLEKIADFYFHTPNVFEALMNAIFKGKSQSDLAKEKHVSRQCINKRLLQELTIAQKRNDIQERRDRELRTAQAEYRNKINSLAARDDFLKTLSCRDFHIYHCRFIKKHTAKHTATLCNCDIRTVFRVSQFIRRKLDISVTTPGRRKKRNAKKNTDND